jgi:Na+-transporting NADH:ubiquinone oxidoreductase subunit A
LAPIPKVTVEVGDEVKAGDVIFHDKKLAHIKFVAPVSGEIVEVRRGEKRAIAEVIILADKEVNYKKFEAPSTAEASREDIVNFLCDAGAWPLINERPFDVTPAVETIPKNIFISTFDTAPLAPDQALIVDGREVEFQKGLDTLARLTSGKVYLGLSANDGDQPHNAFVNAAGVEKTYFKGKHPSGNVGVQIHHTAPINPGDQVWTLTVQDVITIGTLMYKGIFDVSRIVAITGAQVATPAYVRTYLGANIGELVSGNLKEGKSRIIAGDVLTGKTSTTEDFMPFNGDQITVISEGDYYEMFGWLLPIAPRPTISKTFPNFLFPNLKFDGDTNSHGEHRAFVVSGQYEEVLPMNIYPQHLMKAIMTGDFEQMEGLGIHELSEEDIALCEFACTSKMQLQEILRDGLDLVREQG